MKMIKMFKKSNLDEFQEQKLLKIESRGFWIAFWGLFIVFFIQYIIGIGKEDFFKNTAGELILLVCLAFYMEVACTKQGLWDRRLKPTPKNNLIISLIAGLFAGVMVFLASYFAYGKLTVSIIVGILTGIITFILAWLGLLLTTSIYKKRLAKLENIQEPTDEENILD